MTFNPIAQAVSLAWAELSSDKACEWYFDHAWNDTLTTAEAFNQLCLSVVLLGRFCRCLVDDWISPPVELASEPPLLLPALSSLPKYKLQHLCNQLNIPYCQDLSKRKLIALIRGS